MLIAMPDANIGPGGYSKKGVRESLEKFKNEITKAVIPFVEKHYKVRKGPDNRALAGHSFGGLHALYTGFQSPDLFSYLGVFSSRWILPMLQPMADAQYDYLKKNGAKVNEHVKLFWIADSGKEDIAYKNYQMILKKLDKLHINQTESLLPLYLVLDTTMA